MKLNYKSRNGFTLIELLVVIGILAVLAAIAIPSVAGLIDRANVSADNTNANEMTNAIERFTSEYELYCQDIASGIITSSTTDFDSVQGRVYNVISAKTRAEISEIEKAQSVKVADVGTNIAIYRDTKYPVNATTIQKIVENYTKTSSSTFEPKQSDMHYWYSPDCGTVVVAESTKTPVELDKYITSGMDAKGNDITSDSVNAQWIDLTSNVTNNDVNDDTSFDWTGIDKNTLSNNTWENVKKVISNGKISETQWKVGDISPSFTHNGLSLSARIIGINQDGANTVTFMITSGLENVSMGSNNSTGYNGSNIAFKLNYTNYNKLSEDVKSVIKPVTKVNNYGQSKPTSNDSATHKLFLLSVKEVGLIDEASTTNLYPITSIEAESSFVYTYFQTNGAQRRAQIATECGGFAWLRTAYLSQTDYYVISSNGSLAYAYGSGTGGYSAPAFVVG